MSVQVRPQAPNIILEEYPSLVEGTGLENQQVAKVALGFESLFLRHIFKIVYRGMEQLGSSLGS